MAPDAGHPAPLAPVFVTPERTVQRRLPHSTALLLLVLSAAACSPGQGAPPTHLASVHDSAGITVIETHALDWGEDPLRIPDEGPQIGPHFLGGEQEIAGVRHMAFTPGGELLLVSARTPLLRRYSAGGELRNSTDGTGLGEEPRALSLVATGRDGAVDLWIRDQGRIVTAGPDGEIQASTSFAPPTDGEVLRVVGGTHVLVRQATWVEDPGDDSRAREEMTLELHPLQGGEVVPIGTWQGRRSVEVAGRWEHVPFTVTPAVVAGEREIVVTGPGGELLVHDVTGRLVRILRTGVSDRAVSDGDREAFLRAGTAELGEDARDRLEAMLEAVPEDMRIPAFDQLVMASSGELWARRIRTDPAGPVRWSVIDRRGHRLGEMETPFGLGVMAVHDDRIAGFGYHPMILEIVRIHEREPR